MSEVVQNKYLAITKWGLPNEPGVVSVRTEQVDLKKVEDDEIIAKMRYSCIHPSDTAVAEGKFIYNSNDELLPAKFGNEGE